MEKIKSKIICEWPENDLRDIAYAIPLNNCNSSIRLHVRSGQEAVLVCYDYIRKYRPGIYTLMSENAGHTDDPIQIIFFIKSHYVTQSWKACLYDKNDHVKSAGFGIFDLKIFDPIKFITADPQQEEHFKLTRISAFINKIASDLLPSVMAEENINDTDLDKEKVRHAGYLEECMNIALYPKGIVIRNLTLAILPLTKAEEVPS